MKRIFLITLSLITVSACQSDQFPKFEELGGLRIIALTAVAVDGKPDAHPGQVVTITPWISDLNATGSPTFRAYGCADPGVAFGALPKCSEAPDVVNLGVGNLTTPILTDQFTGAASPAISVSIPSDFLTGRNALEQYNGRAYLIEYQLQGANGVIVTAIKRILVKSNLVVKNSSPSISDFLSDGTTLSSLPTARVVNLAPTFSSGAEAYSQMKGDLSLSDRVETLTTTWFISDGKIKYSRTLDLSPNEYTGPEAAPSGRKSFFIGVTRDGRGGEAVFLRSFP